MKLYAVRVFVRDWNRACDFYGNVLGLPAKFNDGGGWAEYDIGGASLGVERVGDDDTEAKKLVGRFVGISFHVDDIQATYDTLSGKGVRFQSPPREQPWGGIVAHFEDPEGNVLTLLGMP